MVVKMWLLVMTLLSESDGSCVLCGICLFFPSLHTTQHWTKFTNSFFIWYVVVANSSFFFLIWFLSLQETPSNKKCVTDVNVAGLFIVQNSSKRTHTYSHAWTQYRSFFFFFFFGCLTYRTHSTANTVAFVLSIII